MTGGAVVDVLGGQTPQIPSERGDIALSLVIPTFQKADDSQTHHLQLVPARTQMMLLSDPARALPEAP